MIVPNADITIVHMNDEQPPDIEYIYGVEWQGDIKTTVTDKGVQADDMVSIFIPKSSKDKVTMRKTDFVVRGLVDFAELTDKALLRALAEVNAVTILSIADNLDFTPGILAHIELGCK